MRSVLERVLNLLAFLLTAGRPVTAEEIRATVAGYDRGSQEAFRRMFERDKQLLRRLGIPIQLRPTDAWEVEHGYVIPPDEYRLPDPDLTDEERAALWLAAQAVRIGGRPSGPDAVLKLGGARTTAALEPFGAELGAEVELLGDLYTAITERRLLRFRYRDRSRQVQPHGLVHRRGHWYLVGKEGVEARVFRVDRIGEVSLGDEAHAFERDAAVDLRKELAEEPWQVGVDEAVKVMVRFEPEVAWWAVRRIDGDRSIRARHPDGGIDVEVEVTHLDAFFGWVLGFGDQAEVLEPPEIRQAIVDRVRGA